MFNKIAPKSPYESFVMKLQLLTKDELDAFAEKARAQHIPEDQIQFGLRYIESLKSHN